MYINMSNITVVAYESATGLLIRFRDCMLCVTTNPPAATFRAIIIDS